MIRTPVTAAWLAGLLLALLVLLAGATPLWIQLQLWLDWLTYALIGLSGPVILLLRAAAFGLALTAVLLARAAAARGIPVRGTIAAAAILWIVVIVAFAHGPPGLRWGLASIIALAATLSLSRRTPNLP